MGERKRPKRHLWHKTPYDGVPGFYAAFQRFLYQFEGPAQLGDRNEPAYVVFTAVKVAELMGRPLDEVWRATGENALAFLGL